MENDATRFLWRHEWIRCLHSNPTVVEKLKSFLKSLLVIHSCKLLPCKKIEIISEKMNVKGISTKYCLESKERQHPELEWRKTENLNFSKHIFSTRVSVWERSFELVSKQRKWNDKYASQALQRRKKFYAGEDVAPKRITITRKSFRSSRFPYPKSVSFGIGAKLWESWFGIENHTLFHDRKK